MLVDNEWVLFGSANWDARSLRLNFELNVECYDVELARSLRAYAEAHLQKAEALTFERLESRSAFERVRDGMARLFVPYL
jgi:cardiolipin synthase